MGSISGSRWESKVYLVPVRETISLVGKSMEMLGTTLGGLAPHATKVGQIKLEAPP